MSPVCWVCTVHTQKPRQAQQGHFLSKLPTPTLSGQLAPAPCCRLCCGRAGLAHSGPSPSFLAVVTSKIWMVEGVNFREQTLCVNVVSVGVPRIVTPCLE